MAEVINALVRYEYGQAVTTSLNVAEHFGKRHEYVVRGIKRLLGGLSNLANAPQMFYKVVHQNAQNKQFYDMYVMNRDGFSLLVLGFTGQDALEWKLKYIKAFNEMEDELRGGIRNFANTPKEPKELPHDYLSALKALVASEEAKQLMQPKADYFDDCMESKALFTTTDVAKELGYGQARVLNDWLVEHGVLYRVGYHKGREHYDKTTREYHPASPSNYPLRTRKAYDFLVSDGYAKIITTPYQRYLKWTNKGVKWLKDFVSEHEDREENE